MSTGPIKKGRATESILLPNAGTVEVPLIQPTFDRWEGPPIENDYGGKPVLGYDGKAVFAELAILRLLGEDGWTGVWVDTYRNRYLTDLPENDGAVELASAQEALLDAVHDRNGSRSGYWDVFVWRDDEVLFAESKWKDNDVIRHSQRAWLEAALEGELSPENFLMVEWSLR